MSLFFFFFCITVWCMAWEPSTFCWPGIQSVWCVLLGKKDSVIVQSILIRTENQTISAHHWISLQTSIILSAKPQWTHGFQTLLLGIHGHVTVYRCNQIHKRFNTNSNHIHQPTTIWNKLILFCISFFWTWIRSLFGRRNKWGLMDPKGTSFCLPGIRIGFKSVDGQTLIV